MNQNWLKKNKIWIIFISALLVCLIAGWVLYFLFGHQFVKAMYEGRSIEVLNRVIENQNIYQLEHYFEVADRLFFGLSAIGALSFIFLFSIWSGRTIIKKVFLCLIILLSLFQASLLINFKNMDDLFIDIDHPKFYSYTVENANLLIKYGTPFGFNHNFQGGIPTFFYLRSCFLELIPFSFFLGERLGYQVMLIFFIALIPFSLFFLIFELTKNEDIARLVSFISTFQLGPWLYLYYGITPAVVAIPLSFLSLLFFLKYLYNKKHYLFPLFLFSGLLAYTHLVIFAITLMFFAIIFIYKLITQKELYSDFKKIIHFGLLSFLICLPFYYNLFNYASFLRTDWFYYQEKALFDYILQRFLILIHMIKLGDIFLLSIFFLLFLYLKASEPKARLKLRNALIFSLIIFSLQLLTGIPNIQVFIDRIEAFIPYIVTFNLSLFLLLRIKKPVKIFGIIVLLFIILNQYPLRITPLKTVGAISEIDNEINAFILPGDFVLFENCAYLNPAKSGQECDLCDCHKYSHWLTYLQKDLGVKFFSQMGGDPHPYNNLRHMYITDGFYREEPLGKDNEREFIALLKDWGVNKVCAWSPTSKLFFDKSRYFKLLGKSKKYTCYIATYEILSEVKLNKGGVGRLIEETPFSFTVYLENISQNQTVIINKNYFNFWSAYNEKRDKIPLRTCNQKICFDATDNGYVFFKYRKNILLNLISLLTLFFILISDVLRNNRIFKKSRK